MSQSPQSLSITSAHMAAGRETSVNKRIFHALLSLSSAALLIRVIGMLNQIVVSAHFGAGAMMDAYFVASMLPMLIAQLIISAIEASVIPVYARVCTQATKKQISLFFSTLLNLLLASTVLLTLVMLIFRQQVLLLSAPALDLSRLGLAIDLAPFIFPVLLLMVVIGFLESIFNTEGQFGWPAYAGMLVPLTTALFVLVVGRSLGVVTLCVGMLIGLCLQLCVFIVRARHIGLVYRPIIDVRNPEIGTILTAAWPVLLGALISQASPLVDQIFASFLSAGSISAISYSLKIISAPVGVIFMSVGRAALPYLSRQASINDMKAFKGTLRLYLWIVGTGTTVLTVFMIGLAHPLVQILFQRGAFSADDTNRTASTLIGFAVGLTPMSLGFTFARAFSALGKTKVLMGSTIFTVIANAIFDYFFARFWQSPGIALATSAVYICIMVILFLTLRHMIGKLDLFTPPPELLAVIRRRGIGKYYMQWRTWKDGNRSLFSISSEVRRQFLRIGIMLAVFIVGVVGVFLNSVYTLRAAFGSLVILAFLRYRYVLLIAWALINAFIGSSVPFLTGNNFLTGLTVPTLLLMVCVPIRQTFKRMPALTFLLFYLLWVFASIGISTIGVGSFLTLWITFLDYVAIGVLTINVLTTRWRLMGLIDAILFVSTVIALYGFYSYITRQNGSQESIAVVFRINSVFGSSQTLALFLSIVTPLAFYRTLTLRGLKCIGSALVLLVLLLALGLTFTRAASICTTLSFIIMVFFLPARKVKICMLSIILVLVVLAMLLATVGHVSIFSRFFNNDFATLNGRIYLWRALLEHFDPTQLLGNGFYASDALLTRLRVSDTGTGIIATAPHNMFLATLYDHGIIGVILLTLVFIRLATSLITEIRKASNDQRMLAAMALAVCVSVFLQSLETRDIWIQGVGIYFWIVMALPFALCWPVPKQPPETEEVSLDTGTEPEIQDIQQVDDEAAEPRIPTIQKAEQKQVAPTCFPDETRNKGVNS